MLPPEQFNVRSQDLEPAFHDVGQFYWGKTDEFLVADSLFSPRAVPLKVPSWRVHDIDTEDDWDRAEILFKILSQRGEL